MKNLEHRQRQLSHLDPNAVKDALETIENMFRAEWLEDKKGSNPLQQLWRRTDTLANNELFAFGTNLKTMQKIDRKWTAYQAQQIKTNQHNNIQGALFEINALGLFHHDHQKIEPSKKSHPGYDGLLSFDDGKKIRISLKNYGMSVAQKEFETNADLFRIHLKKLLAEKKIAALQFFITTEDTPDQADWKDLTDHFSFMLDQYLTGTINEIFVGIWYVGIAPIPDPNHNLSLNWNSYTLVISAPYHKNEGKNLVDKLESAASNISKHYSVQDTSAINAVLVRLPETASIEACVKWAEEYFIAYPNKPVASIMFIQTTCATDLEKKFDFIHICFKYITRKSFDEWNDPTRKIQITFPVGKTETEPSKNKIIISTGDKKDLFDADGRYFYQRGDHFVSASVNTKGELYGNIQQNAPGIFEHVVFRITPDEPEFAIQGRFPSSHQLLLL